MSWNQLKGYGFGFLAFDGVGCWTSKLCWRERAVLDMSKLRCLLDNQEKMLKRAWIQSLEFGNEDRA